MIPKELKEKRQWIAWKYETKDGRKTKVPYNVITKKRASSTDPRSWTDFVWADLAVRRGFFDGLGFVFTEEDPFCGIDIDHCRDPETGKLREDAEKVLKDAGSYAEISPSGTGIHIIGTDPLRAKDAGRKKDGYEVYHNKRFFTVTGMEEGHYPLKDISDAVTALFGTVLTKPAPITNRRLATPENLPDEKLLARLFKQKNGALLEALYAGDNPPESRGGDPSRNDLLFCWMVNLRNGNDLAQTDRIFRSSGRMREKWDKVHFSSGETYGEMTLRKSMARA